MIKLYLLLNSKSVFQYDDSSYPTEQIENASGNLGYLKSEYFYE
jgi:hypothetical protein